MTTVEPTVTITGRYPVGKTAKILEIDRKTLLRYSDEGLIKFGIRRANGRKFYTGSEILRFWKSQY